MDRRQVLLSAAAVVTAGTSAPTPTRAQTSTTAEKSSEDLSRRTIERRAVEAAIWGMPAVSMAGVLKSLAGITTPKISQKLIFGSCRSSDD